MKSTIKLGMPHLTYHGLDPVWLAKHFGDCHWNMLEQRPYTNVNNERLYASFFCWSLDFGQGQQDYSEGEQVELQSQLFKFNSQIYRSLHTLSNGKNLTTGIFDSVFVKKDLGNQKLVRDEPNHVMSDFETTDLVFLDEHKKLKLQLRQQRNFDNYVKLNFNPESMFNAVKILYCANYLHLVFQSEWLHYPTLKPPIKTIKIYYFANIEPTDSVLGQTIMDHGTSSTTLIANGKPIALCVIDRQ